LDQGDLASDFCLLLLRRDPRLLGLARSLLLLLEQPRLRLFALVPHCALLRFPLGLDALRLCGLPAIILFPLRTCG
jgi:hypothetical protein